MFKVSLRVILAMAVLVAGAGCDQGKPGQPLPPQKPPTPKTSPQPGQ